MYSNNFAAAIWDLFEFLICRVPSQMWNNKKGDMSTATVVLFLDNYFDTS